MLAVGIAAVLAASAAYNAGRVLQALDARNEPANAGSGWRSSRDCFAAPVDRRDGV